MTHALLGNTFKKEKKLNKLAENVAFKGIVQSDRNAVCRLIEVLTWDCGSHFVFEHNSVSRQDNPVILGVVFPVPNC